jgi:hypothetical protein
LGLIERLRKYLFQTNTIGVNFAFPAAAKLTHTDVAGTSSESGTRFCLITYYNSRTKSSQVFPDPSDTHYNSG